MIFLKIFIAGPRVIHELDEKIKEKLQSICDKNYEVLVGDADGIDSSIQKFLKQKSYRNVKVYASKGLARNNYGNWQIENVKVEDSKKGFDFYAQKDLEMAKDTEIGFMIWNGKSRGTFNNIINLLNFDKEVILYYTQNRKFYHLKDMNNLNEFLNSNIKLDNKLKALLPKKTVGSFVQVCLF